MVNEVFEVMSATLIRYSLSTKSQGTSITHNRIDEVLLGEPLSKTP